MKEYKTEFELIDEHESHCGEVVIDGKKKYADAHVRITLSPSLGLGDKHLYLYKNDLEPLARSILKALNKK